MTSATITAESQCSYVMVSPVIGTTLNTGSGQFYLSPFVLGTETPVLFTDFDTLVNFTHGSGWKQYIFKESNQPACAESDTPPSPPDAPSPPFPQLPQSPPPPPAIGTECIYTEMTALDVALLDTGYGGFDLSVVESRFETPILYTDYDTFVKYDMQSGWSKTVLFDGTIMNEVGLCVPRGLPLPPPPIVQPQSPLPPQPPSDTSSAPQRLHPPPSGPQQSPPPAQLPPFPRASPDSPNDVIDIDGLRALADSLREQAENARSEAEEARSIATSKREEANAMREDADLKASEAETKTNAAQASRDKFMETITNDITMQKAMTLIDAAIAGAAVTKVAVKLAAVDDSSACALLFAIMQLDASSGVCDARQTARRRLLDSTFDIELILSHAWIEEDTISSAITALTEAGVESSATEEEPFSLLYSVAGLDEAALRSLEFEASAAAEAMFEAQAAETAARAAEADATSAESSAAALEAEAANLEAEVADLEAQIIAVEEMQRKQTSTPMKTVVAALVAAGIVGPGTVFSILALCFKPFLRRKLLQCGFRRLADIVVPDIKSDVKLMSVKMSELEAFVSKQKLPRFLDITPEIEASEIEVDSENVLGAGGYGTIFQASYNGTPVALKALLGINNKTAAPANVVKMMRREATIMCSLNHPNIIRVHGIVPARGWIVMELCEGGALDDYIRDEEEIIDASMKSRICSEIATGITYLHMRDVSVIHGDLKAANVLLTREKSVRICDFGMSETKNRSKTMTASSAGGGAALTVAWSAPELFEDEPKSFATDVYALGLTLWEVYERRVPFGNMPEAAVVSQVLSGKRPKLSASLTPSPVQRIIQACWSAEPRKRPTADRIAYVLTDLWMHSVRRSQRSGTDTQVLSKSAASKPERPLLDDTLESSISAEEEDVVIELKEDKVTK